MDKIQDNRKKDFMAMDDVRVSLQKFGWPDYLVFVLMLLSCSLIGIYFALKLRKCKDDKDTYLVGGRKMQVFPVTMSLIASFISGITLLGTPTEIYLFGIQYMYVIGGILIMGLVMMTVYLPVFHDLRLTSTYQYLETRFDKRMRLFGSVLFTLGSMTWLPIVIYVPALAFNQATGVNIHLITPIVCIVCIFYTCVGGLKAVVWTDVVQLILMFTAMGIIIIKGTYDNGGVGNVLRRAYDSGRLEFPDFSSSVKARYTIWSLVIGGFPHWLKSNAVSQNMIQRYLSLPTLACAKRALWFFILGIIILMIMCAYSGLLIYAAYHDCDPLSTKLAKAKDQVLPLFVMETLGDYPGLPGMFVAGVFSAALSSLSTGLNSMSAVALEDFFKLFCKRPLTERQTAIIMRAVVVVFGAICVSLVFIVEKLGTVLQLSMSLSSISNGPLLGIFTIGVLLPWVEGKGALIGGSTGLVLMAWLVGRAQTAIASGELIYKSKPLATNGCSYTFMPSSPMNMVMLNTTRSIMQGNNMDDESFKIYQISYLWYTFIGASITIGVALIASFILGANDPNSIDPNLLSPFVRKLLKKYESKKTSSQPRLEPVGTENSIRFASTIDLKIISKEEEESQDMKSIRL